MKVVPMFGRLQGEGSSEKSGRRSRDPEDEIDEEEGEEVDENNSPNDRFASKFRKQFTSNVYR